MLRLPDNIKVFGYCNLFYIKGYVRSNDVILSLRALAGELLNNNILGYFLSCAFRKDIGC